MVCRQWVVAMVPMGVSIGGVFVEISVVRHFIVDDEPLALGIFTASDVATERSGTSRDVPL